MSRQGIPLVNARYDDPLMIAAGVDESFSRIAITRSVDTELTVGDTLHMHPARAGAAEVRPASGEEHDAQGPQLGAPLCSRRHGSELTDAVGPGRKWRFGETAAWAIEEKVPLTASRHSYVLRWRCLAGVVGVAARRSVAEVWVAAVGEGLALGFVPGLGGVYAQLRIWKLDGPAGRVAI